MTSTSTEEEAAGLLLALPSNTTTATEKTKEEEMPCTGSLLLDLPLQLLQEQQPFSQGSVVNNKGKGGEGGKDDPEVPACGSLFLSDKKNKRKWWHATRAHNKIKKRKEKKLRN